jgi:flagellar export protein FliJ
MQRFHFRLKSVLGWRTLQLEIERSRLEALVAERRRAEEDLAQLSDERAAADKLLGSETVEGQALAALDAHRYSLERAAGRLRAARADCERRIAAQRATVLAAERQVRLLEKLKERRLAEWRLENDRELEALASETFLAKWVREKT